VTRVREVVSTMGEAFHCAVHDNCFLLARAAAYSAALSLFPGLMVLAALLFSRDATQVLQDISELLGQVLPPAVHVLLAAYLTVSPEHSSAFLGGAALAAVLFAADMISSLMEGFRAAYRTPRRKPLWKDYVISVALVFISVFPVGLANALLIFARQIETGLMRLFGERWWIVESFRFAWWGIAMGTMIVMLAALYYIAPLRKQRIRNVAPGAVAAALLWAPTTALFAYYVQHLARYSDLYGNVSTVIVLLIWLYFSSAFVLLGAELNATRERRLGTLAPRPLSHR